MTATGMPTPIPNFVPVVRPDEFEVIEVGNAVVNVGNVPVVGSLVGIMVEALASTSASELC
jgi:hypothetical protein